MGMSYPWSLDHQPAKADSTIASWWSRIRQIPHRGAMLLMGCFVFAIPHSYSSLHAQSVALNEIMASNGITIADEDGDFEDWIELHNHGAAPVSLDGFGLSDNRDHPFRWVFPNVTINPGQFLLVWASGKDRRNPTAPLHASFAISASGENLFLTRPDGVRLDETPTTLLGRDLTIGRVPDGTGDWFFFNEPTPLAPNTTTAYTGLLSPPELSLPSGFYPAAREVVASHDRFEHVVLRYTLDGSKPEPNSPLLSNPLMIHPRVGEPNVFSSIKTTAGNDFWQAPDYDVPKATVLRVRAFSIGDEMPSPTITRTYFLGSHFYRRHSFPVLSLVTDGAHLFDDQTGIYVAGAGYDGDWQNANFSQRGRDWERPVHIELFETDGSLGFAQDAGVRIHSGSSRRAAFKSLRFYARTDYGDDAFDYPLFPAEPYESYRRFIARNSGTDHEFTLFRDAFMQRFVAHLRFDTQAYQPAVIYINGEYWGIQNIRERYDHHYLHRTYGVDPDNLDLLTNDREVKEGCSTHYDQLLDHILLSSLESPHALDHIHTRMDLDNFIDYQVAQIYLNNTDWPGNNIDFWRLRTDAYIPDAPYGHDGRWRWMVFDTDFGFWQYNGAGGDRFRDHPGYNTLAFATAAGITHWPNPDWSTFLLRSLLKNQSFRFSFINRFADQLNSAFLPQRALTLINEMAAALQPEIAAHIQRFGRPQSLSSWNVHVERMRSFASQRPNHQFDHILSHFNLPGTYRLTVNLDAPAHGNLRVNSLLIDPASPGVRNPAFPWTGRYFHAVPVRLEAIPDPDYRFARWHSPGKDFPPVPILTLLPELSHPSTQHINITAVFEPALPDPDPLSFLEWMEQWGFSETELADPDIGAPHADPDHDGVPNLLEYALDGNPLTPHTATFPSVDLTEPVLTMTFPQDPTKTDLAWIVQSSVDLLDWSGIVYDSRLHRHAPTPDRIARIPIHPSDNLPDADHRFFRLKVILLEPAFPDRFSRVQLSRFEI
jgi:hypothetical protein